MKRADITSLLSPYVAETNISFALELLADNDDKTVCYEDIRSVWEYVSKSVDQTFSDDENHSLSEIEIMLSKNYYYD